MIFAHFYLEKPPYTSKAPAMRRTSRGHNEAKPPRGSAQRKATMHTTMLARPRSEQASKQKRFYSTITTIRMMISTMITGTAIFTKSGRLARNPRMPERGAV